MQRLFFALFLALALLLASLPARAGAATPLAADPVGSFLGITLVLFAAGLVARSAVGLARVRARRGQ
jgi:hypothetical protein